MKHPYQYLCKIEDTLNIIKTLKSLGNKEEYHCYLINTKPISKGVRLDIFVLTNHLKISKDGWDNLTRSIQTELNKLLKKDTDLFVEPYTTDHKFQIRFTGYIMYDAYL